MSLSLDLSKQSLQLTLEKNQININNMDVDFAMDVSGSFDDEHRHGYTQQFLNRFVPFALLFDPDKKMGMYAFSHRFEQLSDVTERNYENYVKSKIMTCSVYDGMTEYAEVLTDIVKPTDPTVVEQAKGFLSKLFGSKEEQSVKTGKPKICFFVTDGEPSDKRQTRDVLEKLKTDNTYIVFVSISSSPIQFLTDLSNIKNVSYLNFTPNTLRNLQDVSDDSLYEQLLTPELIDWLKKYNAV